MAHWSCLLVQEYPCLHPPITRTSTAWRNRLWGGVVVREQYGEQRELVDHFLGRAKDAGVHIHERVRHILSDARSTPNLLHTTLLRLFRSCSDVRLVTTNFDPHFITAAKTVFSTGDELELYYAPALSVGNSFAGIVHLHGSVTKQADRMVLTDSDFGAAYLTEGWATRFLQRLFAHNVVMFIGYVYSYKPEVFLVLQKGYANASEDVRTKVVEQALKGSDVLEERIKDYEVYNLVHWLAQTAPDCMITKKRLDEFVRAHPDFQPREHPNLNWWVGSGGFLGPVSPLRTDEILSSTAEKLLADLAAAKRGEFTGPSREGLLRGVSEAVARQPEWSLDLVRTLKVKGACESDLWKAIVSGWTQAVLTEGQWTEVLTTLLDTNQVASAVTYEGAQLLESGIAKASHAIPITGFPLSVRVSENFWIACVASTEGSTGTMEDWSSIAINRPAGTLVRFWLKMLSRLREQAGKSWTGIPAGHKKLFSAVLDGKSYAAAVGRVLIAAELLFLFNLERGWAIEHVIPLFDFSKDSQRAIQAWHGYLGWGRWNEELLGYLMPYFEEAFPRLHSDFAKEQRERFCEYLAGIACHSSINPIQNGWLNRFLLSVTEEERVMWASYVRGVLKGMKEPAVESAWNNWVKNYWQNRIEGIPLLLVVSEASAMVDWPVCFKDSFPDVAENVYRSPVPKREHFFLFEELSESDLLTRHPGAMARFVFYLLRNRVAPLYYFEPILKIVNSLRPFPDARNDLLQICQQLAELGYPNAGALRDLILGTTQEVDTPPASPTPSG
jgi:Domain of unknown function (DUF4020)/SIR2-like domain